MPANNLPLQPTSFVGREKELAEIAALLADSNCRLLTLVGVGGIGKTRVAIQAAVDQKLRFADGVAFVPLAPIVSHNLLASAIAGVLEISFFGSEEPRIQLISYLCEKQILLVMDNFEHLLEGVGLVSELLQAAPGLKILATSRERLNVQEEWAFALDGLSYPSEFSIDSSESYSAVQLFIQRARQVQAHFAFDQNAQAVGSICRKLEGMPLGLELAASWLRVMSCQQIEGQIASDFNYLTTPLRNIPERHRSLRAVFTQSWDLLSSDEQATLMHLSVFRGGFDLEAAEKIAGASLRLLAGLADKSLIRLNASGRYDLHELLRQYAAEKLTQAQETDTIAHRHLDYFIQLAEEAESHLFSRQQIPWFDRLEVEMDNFRAAFAYSAQSEAGLHLATSLGWFFSECSYWREGLEWFERTLAANPKAPTALLAKAYHLVGGLAGHFGDPARLVRYCQKAIEIGNATDNKKAIAWALAHLGLYDNTDLQKGGMQLQESIALFRQIGDVMGMTHCLIRLAWNSLWQENTALARECVDEAAVLSEQAGDMIMLGWVYTTYGRMARFNHEYENARVFFKRSAAFFREAKLMDGVNLVLLSLAAVELKLGNVDESERVYKKALRLHRGVALNHPALSTSLAGLAHIALIREQYECSARLLAAAEVDWLIDESRRFPEKQPFEHNKAVVQARLGEAAFKAAWAEGKAMSNRQAEEYALEDLAQPAYVSNEKKPVIEKGLPSNTASNHSLSLRERDIIRLLSEGLNSREIAERLVLSVETIRWYIKIIYSKLDVHSRSEAIAQAKERNLLM